MDQNGTSNPQTSLPSKKLSKGNSKNVFKIPKTIPKSKKQQKLNSPSDNKQYNNPYKNTFMASDFFKRLEKALDYNKNAFHRILNKIIDFYALKISIDQLIDEITLQIPQPDRSRAIICHFVHLFDQKESLRINLSYEANLMDKIYSLVHRIGQECPSFLKNLAFFDPEEGIEGLKPIIEKVSGGPLISELKFYLGLGDRPSWIGCEVDFMDLTDHENKCLDDETLSRRLKGTAFDSGPNFFGNVQSPGKGKKRMSEGCAFHKKRDCHCFACVFRIRKNKLFWCSTDNMLTPIDVVYSKSS